MKKTAPQRKSPINDERKAVLIQLPTEKILNDAAAALQTAVQANPFGIMQVQSLKETMVNPGAVASLFEPKRPSKKQIVPL
jgi:hypothetical protein